MKLLLNLAQRRLTRALKRLRHDQPRITSTEARKQFLRVMRCSASLLLAFTFVSACAAPQPPPGGYSKEEQAAIRQEERERRAAWRKVGVAALDFGLSAASAELNGDRGFRK